MERINRQYSLPGPEKRLPLWKRGLLFMGAIGAIGAAKSVANKSSVRAESQGQTNPGLRVGDLTEITGQTWFSARCGGWSLDEPAECATKVPDSGQALVVEQEGSWFRVKAINQSDCTPLTCFAWGQREALRLIRLAGDATNDGRVDVNDLVWVGKHYQLRVPIAGIEGDVTYNYVVDLFDLVMVAKNLGRRR